MGKEIDRIKIVLEEKHRTSKRLADSIDKDPTTVSKWRNNSSRP